jgi:hypothetical protein
MYERVFQPQKKNHRLEKSDERLGFHPRGRLAALLRLRPHKRFQPIVN